MLSGDLLAHGNVVDDNDICQLEVGFLKAHFKIYLPRTHKREEFCEDLPAPSESVFVMEYEHDLLSSMLIDFRIIPVFLSYFYCIFIYYLPISSIRFG